MFDVIVIGAGASGILAAGRAAQKGAKVLLIEKMRSEGRKILITGKGRCNITNEDMQSEFLKHIYPNGKFLKYAFSRFFSKEIVEILNNEGVETVVERGGRVFPKSNQSSDVLNGLLKWMNKTGNVETRCGTKLIDIIVEDNMAKGVVVEDFNNKNRERIYGKNIIVCVGGNSYPATGSSGDCYKLLKSLGHSVEAVRPALVPLETEGDTAGKLQGLSLKNVKAIIWVNGKKAKEEFGEMLFTHFGISGPIVLTLSRFVVDELRNKSKVQISIDLKPALDDKKLDNRLQRDLDANGKKRIENICKLWLPSKFINVLLELGEINPDKLGHQINAKERKRIKNLMKEFSLDVSGHRSFKEAVITAGGVDTKEIEQKTMQSKIVEGLFFGGEIIDLDADTGGYNLQIAFSTGWLAGDSCVL